MINGINWVFFNINKSDTFPREGKEVLISDDKNNYDVAYFVWSGSYKWLKVNVSEDNVHDFTSFVPVKWKYIN